MKKTTLIILLIIFTVLLIIVAIYYISRSYLAANKNSNNASNSADLLAGLVEYQDSMGKTCPLGVKLLGARDANPIGCQCPADYETNSEIIGYATGDSCYGPGTECPIMSSECVKINK